MKLFLTLDQLYEQPYEPTDGYQYQEVEVPTGYEHQCWVKTALTNKQTLLDLEKHGLMSHKWQTFVDLLDSWTIQKEDTFNMYTKHKIVKFKRNKDGLYTYKPLQCYYDEVKSRNEGMNNMITTVTENKVGFTKRQIEDAKTARKLYHTMGCPTVQNFKAIL